MKFFTNRSQTPYHTEGEPTSLKRLKRVLSQCSFVNICGKECGTSPARPLGRTLCPMAVFSFLVALLSTLTLAIMVLVSYDQLMIAWQFYTERLPINGCFDMIANLSASLWTEMKHLTAMED